ncbi:hypothetical protein [Variovorax sp. PCZ-1]|uniref:hypothetical protein n=1 Tax=Variovorax sp. PCZ-1 TaxID=2835533 RepID=UPI001BCB4C6F|nr:hypothetical protein [Variovorax sp. PCZ-1]MBS7808133.1 hypothetical protein [Variovorax sp. PCZ-1]
MSAILRSFYLDKQNLLLKSNVYPAKWLSIRRIPNSGVWLHAASPRGHAPSACRIAQPVIPILGASDAVMVKYPG